MSKLMTKDDLYTPIFAKIGEPPVEIPEGKRTDLDLDEIPFTEIINLCEELIALVVLDFGKWGCLEIEEKYLEPLINKAKKILEILL